MIILLPLQITFLYNPHHRHSSGGWNPDRQHANYYFKKRKMLNLFKFLSKINIL